MNKNTHLIWVDNSKIIAIFAVVILHASCKPLVDFSLGTTGWWIGNIYDSIVRWCVPVFVMLSGATLLDPSKNEDLKTFYKKRISKILIPVVFWSIFFLFWTFFIESYKGNDISVKRLIQFLIAGVPHYHMWFLFMIAGLYLFTPFFRKVVSHSTKKELLFLVCAMFVISALHYAYQTFYSGKSHFFLIWFLTYTPYFFLGYLIKQQDSDPPLLIMIAIFIVTSVVNSVGFYLMQYKFGIMDESYFFGYLSIFVIPMSISAIYLLKRLTKPFISLEKGKSIALLTLGIYIIHPVILESLEIISERTVSIPLIINIPLISIVVFVISLLLAWLISNIPFLRKTI